MRVLSIDQAQEMLGTDDLRTHWAEIRRGLQSDAGTFKIPIDSGAKVALAQRIATMLLDRGPVLLWITGWGIWPSSEHRDLFDRYRLSLGESRSLEEAPVHFFDEVEVPTLISLISLGLFFIWDLELLNKDHRVAITVSHDEWIESRISCDERRFRAYFRENIELSPWV